MKKMQLITFDPKGFEEYDNKMDINNFNGLKSLDNYEINVFDLTDFRMWKNKSTNIGTPESNTIVSADFKSIKKMILNSKKSSIIICLPQNVDYTCQSYSTYSHFQLKDIIPILNSILEQLIPIEDMEIIYENSTTQVGQFLVDSSFYFGNEEFEKLTLSSESEKTTTISVNKKLYITTLSVVKKEEPNILFEFLREINLISDMLEFPEWLYNYDFNDDVIQKNNINQAESEIKIQQDFIKKSKQKLEENLHYKSILYSNSDVLVEVVFEILEFIFEISLDEFNDEKKEDFLFKKYDITFIGEIKGVSTNVKYEHISQLDVHYSKYMDKLQDEGITEKIKKILIINYERKKDVVIRDEINQMQIDLAIKNETLIIDTKTLLTIYEKILQGNIDKDKVVDYIKSNSGIVDLDKLK